jgi:DNA-binding beta-propeller fold protein YncE
MRNLRKIVYAIVIYSLTLSGGLAQAEEKAEEKKSPPIVLPHSVEWISTLGERGSGNGQLLEPHGVTVGEDGIVYVADTGNVRVQAMDRTGKFIYSFGKFGFDEGQLTNPVDVIVDGSGAICALDSDRGIVVRYGPDGNFLQNVVLNLKLAPIAFSNRPLIFPQGFCLGRTGGFVIADTEKSRIIALEASGRPIMEFGSYGSGPGNLNYPRGVAVAPDGSIYVADSGNARIQRYDAGYRAVAVIGGKGSDEGRFLNPTGIAVDSQGRLYVCDTGNDRIQIFDAEGRFLYAFGHSGKGDWQFDHPYDIAIFHDQFIFVADAYNNRIAKLAIMWQ